MAAVDQSAFFSMGDHTLKVPMELFALNRRRLADRLREKAPKSVVVLQGGSDSPHYCSDVDYKFQQEPAENGEEEDYEEEWSLVERDVKPLDLQETVMEIAGMDEDEELSNQSLELQIFNSKFDKVSAKRPATARKSFPSRKRSKIRIDTDYKENKTESFVPSDSLVQSESFDSCGMYCQLLAEKLRGLNSRTRIIVQNKIDNLMFQALMDEMGVSTGGKVIRLSKESEAEDVEEIEFAEIDPQIIEIKSSLPSPQSLVGIPNHNEIDTTTEVSNVETDIDSHN